MQQQESFDFHETALDEASTALATIAYKLGQLSLPEIARAYWSPEQLHCANCGCDRIGVERDREIIGYAVGCCDAEVE
jgi:hypothetical protein